MLLKEMGIAHELRASLSIAEDALARAHFQVFFNAQQGGFIVIGGNAQVIVSISCAPQDSGTFVAVTATSDNSSAAEQRRCANTTCVFPLTLPRHGLGGQVVGIDVTRKLGACPSYASVSSALRLSGCVWDCSVGIFVRECLLNVANPTCSGSQVRRPFQHLISTFGQLAIEQLEARDVPSVNVLSYHNDNASSGDNLSETTLRRTAGGTIAQGHGTAATAIRVELPFIGHLSLLIYLCKGTNGSGRKSHYEKTPTA
jgi:hypothetical protein